jgi:hypothetical protein
MTRPRAADDFPALRARMEELRPYASASIAAVATRLASLIIMNHSVVERERGFKKYTIGGDVTRGLAGPKQTPPSGPSCWPTERVASPGARRCRAVSAENEPALQTGDHRMREVLSVDRGFPDRLTGRAGLGMGHAGRRSLSIATAEAVPICTHRD